MRRTRKVFVIQGRKPAELPEPGSCVEIDAPKEDGLLAHEVIAKYGGRAKYTPTGGVAHPEDSW